MEFEKDEELKHLRKDIQNLTQEVLKLQKICSRMDNHISFINSVYSSVRTPLEYIRQKFNYFVSYDIPSKNDRSLPLKEEEQVELHPKLLIQNNLEHCNNL